MEEELKDIDLYQMVLQNKDSSALRKLYQKYEKLIYSFSYKMTGDHEVAEEVIQEVFLKLWKKHAPYEESKGKFSSWLLTMTRNTSLDAIRKRRKYESIGYMEKDSLRVTYDTPENIMEWKEKGSIVRDCISQLKQDQQNIIHLFYYKGHTQQSISDSTGTPLGTVKGRIRLALKHLHQCLKGKGGISSD
jgi:RNA polymerase sigma factor (sigma-70 family)